MNEWVGLKLLEIWLVEQLYINDGVEFCGEDSLNLPNTIMKSGILATLLGLIPLIQHIAGNHLKVRHVCEVNGYYGELRFLTIVSGSLRL